MKKREENIVWKFLIQFQRTIIVITAIAVTVIVASACICRYFLNMDLKAYEEYLVIAAFWLYMMGGAYGSYEKSQITADILDVYLKESRKKSIIRIIKLTTTLILGAVFMAWALQSVIWTINLGSETPVHHIPKYIGELSVFVGLALMSFYHLVYLYDEICIFKSKYVKKIELS